MNHIYGQHEAGGTSWLYLSPVDFSELTNKMDEPRFPDLGTEPVPALSDAVASVGTPVMLTGVAALLAGFYWITKRRMEGPPESAAAKGEEG